MTFVVPFDGSELAETALVRAVEFGTVLDERIVAVSVVPEGNASYARERGWLDPGEAFDLDTVVGRLHETVAAHAPSAEFRYEVVGRRAAPGTIASRLRDRARSLDASMVFVGSENAGRLVSSLSSVGDTVAADDAYDVVIVRHREPSRIDRVDDASPFRGPKSDFYRTG
jgi:nucleotide-binding universal stress UspA family protein